MDLTKWLPVAEVLNIQLRNAVLAGFLFLSFAPCADAQQAPMLFEYAPTNVARAARIDAMTGGPVEVLRSRPASFSLNAWRAVLGDSVAKAQSFVRGADASTTLMLNLFPDTNLPFHAERIAPTSDSNGQTAYGQIGEQGEGSAIFTLYGGALSGSVRLTNREFYEVFVPGSGAGEIRQVTFRGFGSTETDAVPVDGEALPGNRLAEVRLKEREVLAARSVTPIREAGEGAAVVDVLILYTERARQARGDSAGMLAHINQVIAEANTAFDRSEVPIQFRLAHAAEVSWDDSAATMSYSSTLSALRSATDGFLDQAHALREQYAADMVSLWVSPPPGSGSFTVGMAYILANSPSSFAGYAFSVVHQGYAGGSSATFSHETGHNLGLNHDPDNGGKAGGLVADAVGYQQKALDPKFFTIMAYSNGCDGCQPLVQFSNPLVSFQGIPTGVAGKNDAAKTLNLVAPSAAAWRGGVTTPPECGYTLNPANISVPAAGGTYLVSVNTAAGCSWTPVSNASWITVNGSNARTGAGEFSVNVLSNSATSARNGGIEIAGKTVGIAQEGVPVRPNASLQVSSKGISFQSEPGGVPPSQVLRLRSAPAIASLSASAPGASWLSASTSLSGDTWQMTITANARNLAEGVYDATLEFDCGTALCSPGSVPVRFTVRSSGVSAPRIASGGVVNAASFLPGMASGAWMSIFGTNLATSTRLWRPADFQGNSMPRSLDGVQVLVDGVLAPVQFIGPGQVNFQAPSNTATGWVRVEIRSRTGTDFAYVFSSRESPGFFAFDSDGQVAALHPDGVPVGNAGAGATYAARPASVGEVLAIYGTGFGPTTPDVPSGEVFTGVATLASQANLIVTIGGQTAQVRFAGLTGAGLNQINVVVPALAAGTHEIVASIAGSPTQYSGKLTVR